MNSPEFTVIYRAERERVCLERALVLRAVGIEHEIRDSACGCELLVHMDRATEAIEQLTLYDLENTSTPTRRIPFDVQADGMAGVVAYSLVLLTFFYLQKRVAFDVDWLSAGRIDSGRVQDGQWWRTFTALLLHIDEGHLISNLFFGAFFGIFAGQYLGSGLAWASILFAGATGNALNVLIQSPDHRAIGASTAVFATLGILSAISWIRGWTAIGTRASRWAPVIGGIALLAFMGTGGGRTDVGSHLTGFVAGFALGVILGKLNGRLRLPFSIQTFIGILTVAWIFWVWRVALQAHANG